MSGFAMFEFDSGMKKIKTEEAIKELLFLLKKEFDDNIQHGFKIFSEGNQLIETFPVFIRKIYKRFSAFEEKKELFFIFEGIGEICGIGINGKIKYNFYKVGKLLYQYHMDTGTRERNCTHLIETDEFDDMHSNLHCFCPGHNNKLIGYISEDNITNCKDFKYNFARLIKTKDGKMPKTIPELMKEMFDIDLELK
jgi:hypothetical protein